MRKQYCIIVQEIDTDKNHDFYFGFPDINDLHNCIRKLKSKFYILRVVQYEKVDE